MPKNTPPKSLIPRSVGGGARAHVRKIVERTPKVTTLALTEKQLLELAHVISVALRDKPRYQYADKAFRLALWDRAVRQCQVKPPCEGDSSATIDLVARPA